MKRIVFFLIIISTAAAAHAYETYVSDSQLVVELNDLYIRAGEVFPTASFPVDKAELYSFATQLRRKAGNRDIRIEIDRYLSKLSFNAEEREVVSKESLSYEHYFRGNAIYTKDYDYQRSYIDASPFATWALSAGSDGKAGVNISAEVRKQHSAEEYPASNMFEGSDGNPVAVENYFITTGYFARRFDNLFLQFGRTPVHYGEPDFSTILPSDRLPFLDAFYYTWSFGPLKMTSFVSSQYNSAGGSEISDMQNVDWPSDISVDPDGTIIYEPGTGDPDRYVAFDRTMIISAMHRFEWAFDHLRLGLSAMHLSSRENNTFHIGDFFPVFSWHNGQVGPHNMFLVAEASWVPLSGLVLTAQAGYDDINAEDFTGVGDTSIPTIPAYVVGAKYLQAARNYTMTYVVEGGYSHYLWGNFHEFDPDKGNYLSRAIYRYLRDEETVLLPLTSPYGPGAIWVNGNMELHSTSGWTLGLITETVFKNTKASLVTTVYEDSQEVEKAAMELWGYYGFNCKYETRIKNTVFSLFIEPAVVVRDTELWPELSVGGSADFFHRTVIQN
ncbi:MAG: hypothetical protein ACOC7X_11325 [Spirochaetota bacterium]